MEISASAMKSGDTKTRDAAVRLPLPWLCHDADLSPTGGRASLGHHGKTSAEPELQEASKAACLRLALAACLERLVLTPIL